MVAAPEHVGNTFGLPTIPFSTLPHRPQDVIATSHRRVAEMIDAYLGVGASKFVLFPFAEPDDWHAELEQLAPVLEKQT